MMLSRLFLNPASRDVQRALGDAHRMHRTIMSAMPEAPVADARSFHGVLYRCEADRTTGRILLLVQSKSHPDWTKLPRSVLLDLGEELANPATRSMAPVLESLRTGQQLAFRLRANATRKVHPSTERPNGTRVPVRGDDGRIAWLNRHATGHGFDVIDGSARAAEEPTMLGFRSGRRLTFASVLYDGILRVTDEGRFREALCTGIGPAKAFGFGLMSVASPR